MNDPQFGHIVSKTNASTSAMKPGKTPVLFKGYPSLPRRNVSTMVTNTDVKIRRTEDKSCPCCYGRHTLTTCEKFEKRLSTDDKWQIVKDLKLCHICLSVGHMKAQCSSTERCHCNASFYHHKLLHRDIHSRRQTPPHQYQTSGQERKREFETRKTDVSTPLEGTQQSTRSTETYATSKEKGSHVVLLHVVPVRIINNEGHSLTTYGLLDNASRGTMISPELARRLGIDGPVRPFTVTTVLGKQDCMFKEVSFKLQTADPLAEHKPVLAVEGGIVKELNINEKVLPHEIDYDKYPHLADIPIPEVELKRVSLLIGEDVINAHIVEDVIVPDGGQTDLYATKTALGWTIAGRLDGTVTAIPREVSTNFVDSDKLLRDQLDAFWSIENGGLDNQTDKSASVEDRRAEKTLKDTTKLVDGHYETGLLWKHDNPQLPNNRVIAESRLKSLKRKFQRDQEFEARYRKVVQDYIDRGYARKLSRDEAEMHGDKTNYLPHHGVTNPNKPGKVRVVFDAAAKYDGKSLNQSLLQGPDMTNNLLGVLMRFRQGQTGPGSRC